MLHPDSDRRIREITDIAIHIFKEMEYPQTANGILDFLEILKHEEIPSDFLQKWRSLLAILQDEFTKESLYLQDYRRKYFKEISETTVNALDRVFQDNEVFLPVLPAEKRLHNAMKVLGEISEGILHEEIKDKILVFHLFCYRYLIFVEGILDELARIFYLLATVPNSRIRNYGDLEKISIWKIRKQLDPTPVFLRKFVEMKHIRNAIGHARVYYDVVKDKIQFVDVDKKNKVTYDKILDLAIFIEIEIELEGVLTAFYLILSLLNIYDLIVSSDPVALMN